MDIKTIKKLYNLFEKVTPLECDCGELCNHLCCNGDENTGMYLLPGEEEVFKSKEEFSILLPNDGCGFSVLVCNGKCKREERPFACRIYPFFPFISGEKWCRIKVIFDSRAATMCPLICSDNKINKKFIRNVYKSGKILKKSKDGVQYLKEISDVISDIISLNEAIFKEKAENK